MRPTKQAASIDPTTSVILLRLGWGARIERGIVEMRDVDHLLRPCHIRLLRLFEDDVDLGPGGDTDDYVLHRHHPHDLFITSVPDIVSYAHS